MKTEAELLLPPSVLRPVVPGNIPEELKALDQWMPWRAKPRLQKDGSPALTRKGKPKFGKPPHDVLTGMMATEWTKPGPWTSFEEALTAHEAGAYDGLGFCVTADDPFVGIDLDGSRDDETGEIDAWAERIVRKLDSYTEVSPSGEGLRIWVRGTLPLPEPGGRNKPNVYGPGTGIEMYNARHYLTLTGHWVHGTRATIEDRKAEVCEVYAEVFGLGEQVRVLAEPEPITSITSITSKPNSDAELLEAASRARNGNGDKFKRLWAGDISGYPSRSEADLALCAILAFWTEKDAARIDQLFRQSGLGRGHDKWDEPRGTNTYGAITIARAIEGCDRVYEPPIKRTKPIPMQEVLMTMTTAPASRAIPNFPELTAMTGGLRGLWVIGGMPGSGKSTFAMNITANVAGPDFPVLYLDRENDTGPQTREVGERIVKAYGADAPALAHLYGFRHLGDLERHLAEFPPPALIVVDHLQLLAHGDDAGTKRAATDSVIERFVELVGEGYTVLVLSQLGRGAYWVRPGMGHFKESGAIEAGATAALFVWRANNWDPLRVYVPKLRYATPPSYELEVARDGWRFTEVHTLPLPSAPGSATGSSRSSRGSKPKLTEVQKALVKLGGRATTAQLLKRLRKRGSTGERWLTKAVADGEILRPDIGVYTLPDALTSALIPALIDGGAK